MVPTSVPAALGRRATWSGAVDALGPRLAELAHALSEHGLAALLLIPGSHPGETDPFCDRLARWLETGLHTGGGLLIPVHLVEWSGEGHDLGCADGAVRLLDALLALEKKAPQRVLLLGLSQAAHVLALASCLIAAGPETVTKVFQAARVYYRWPLLGCVDIPMWERVRRRLERSPALADCLLDIVVWGPVARYSWRLDSRMRLLHFVQPATAECVEPPRPPERAAWRARLADRRLRLLFNSSQFRSQFGAESMGWPAAVLESPVVTVRQGEHATPGPDLQNWSLSERQQWTLALVEEVVRRFYAGRQLKVA